MIVSTLTSNEYSIVLASVEANLEDAFDCHKCKGRYVNSQHASKRTKALQAGRGCFTNNRLYQLENICYHRCIGNFKSNSVNYLLWMFLNYEKGFLPFDIPLQKHPNKLIEVFSMIEDIRNKHKKKEVKKK